MKLTNCFESTKKTSEGKEIEKGLFLCALSAESCAGPGTAHLDLDFRCRGSVCGAQGEYVLVNQGITVLREELP